MNKSIMPHFVLLNTSIVIVMLYRIPDALHRAVQDLPLSVEINISAVT